MPEGPSIFILRELISPLFKGKKITEAFGNAKIDMSHLTDKKIIDIRSWGKQLLIFTDGAVIRIHLLMFGSYSIDENKKPGRSLRLALKVRKHVLYFYTCSVRILPPGAEDLYDWQADVLSDIWDPVKARKKLKAASPKTSPMPLPAYKNCHGRRVLVCMSPMSTILHCLRR